MRAQGLDMAAVSEAVGVPVPTLYQWAARGKWRFSDLAEQEAETLPEAESTPATKMLPVPVGTTDADPAATDDPPETIARRVLAQSAAAAARGEVAKAETLARLAQRLVDTARKAQALGPDTDTNADKTDPRMVRGEDMVYRPFSLRDFATMRHDRDNAEKRFHDNRLPPGMSAKEAMETLDPKDLPMLLYKTVFMRKLIRASKLRGEVGDDIDVLLTYVPTWAEILTERALRESDEIPIRDDIVAYLLDTSERQSDVDAEWMEQVREWEGSDPPGPKPPTASAPAQART